MLAAAVLLALPYAPQDLFEEVVAPALERTCLRCHDADAREGGLSLATRADAVAPLQGKGPAIVPGSVPDSFLLDLVDPEDPYMPAEGDPLTPDEVAALSEWVEAGAPWTEGRVLRSADLADLDWWSLRPLVRPDVPAIPGDEAPVARNEVDAFVLARLAERGLRLSGGCDRRTLIRRLTFDLHGLPPTPEEVEAFVADGAPGAYERLVERLLASPSYGERWARRWLDVARYADTHGYDKDKRRPDAWRYRDWVIGAINADLPWGEFVRLQVAGDVIAPQDPDGAIATGFLAAGPWDFVGHVEVREGTREKARVRNLDRDEMVAATITAFASTTVHCARCHDHEFDPIDQEDYYALQAVFAGVERVSREVDVEPDVTARRRALEQQDAEQAEREEALARAVDERLAAVLGGGPGRLEELLPQVHAGAPATLGWHSAIEADPGAGAWVQVDLGQSVEVEEVWLLPAHVAFGGHPGPGFGFAPRLVVEVSDDPAFEGEVRRLAGGPGEGLEGPGDAPVIHRPPGGAAGGRYVRVTATRLWERTDDFVFALRELAVLSGGASVAHGAPVTGSGSIEAPGSWGAAYLVDDTGLWARRAAVREAAELREALVEVRGSAFREERAQLARERAALEEELAALPPQSRVYAVASRFRSEGAFTPPPEGAPRPIHLLRRGSVEAPVRPVGPGALTAVTALPARFELDDPGQEGARRRALADWLAHPQNPLTWRSAVNRIWQGHFGRGLVGTPNDLGRMGESPTHPELLDWLAAELREVGSVKHLHRLIVTSATYRQAVDYGQAARADDDDNRLLWRQGRRRLEAEELRDTLLAVSGRLDVSMGGPGFAPFHFEDDHSPRYLYDRAELDAPGTDRRSVYRFVVRSVPDPFLATFDCPDATASAPARGESTTPLQALSMWNDRFVLRQCEHLAARLTRERPTLSGRIDRLVALAWGRPADEGERQMLARHAQENGLPSACRAVVNAAEFLYVD